MWGAGGGGGRDWKLAKRHVKNIYLNDFSSEAMKTFTYSVNLPYIFQILIGVMQKIVYDEYLPAFLSQTAMQRYRLASSNGYSYNSTMNPTISNGFGIAYRLVNHIEFSGTDVDIWW